MKRIASAWVLWAVVGMWGFAVAGCETSPWPVSYLSETVGRAKQADVRKKLGAPNLSARSLDGGAVWTYHYVRGAPGSATYECYEYALTFDQQGIFRNWVQEECLETAPDLTAPPDQGKRE